MAHQEDPATETLVQRLRDGDEDALNHLLDNYRERLRQVVRVRFDPRLNARVDPSDVVQDTYVVAARRISDFLSGEKVPFFVWLRGLAFERLVELQRKHLKARSRTVDLEAGTAASLVKSAPDRNFIEGDHPFRAMLQRERQARIRRIISEFSSEDQELLRLRHLEQLTVREVATVMKLPEGTVKSRHFRLLETLRVQLEKEQDSEGGKD
ncbi:MAG: sigma-70 family RNA polymerase sigma factor [Planctomycetaceae bacterium]|nr:sigma-70 family RNA polymerase sigma factor [Planctomycetaceae bacterium]